MKDEYCNGTFESLPEEDGRTCRDCGVKVCGLELRRLGTMECLKQVARDCLLRRAVTAMNAPRDGRL